MSYYQYCQLVGGFDWIRDCADSDTKILFIVFVIFCILGAILFIAVICDAIDEDAKKQVDADIVAEIEQLRRQTEYDDAQIRAQMKRYQLTQLQQFTKEHDL